MATAMPVATVTNAVNAVNAAWFVRRTEVETLQVDLRTLVELLGGDAGNEPRGGERFAVHRVARGATLLHESVHV